MHKRWGSAYTQRLLCIFGDGRSSYSSEWRPTDCGFFIWNDDFEFSTRLAHHRDAIAVPASVARHHTKTFGTTNAKPGPRFYNDVRNKLWVFTRARTLSPLEKLLYGGSVARLWASTVLRTDEKSIYLGYFLRGIKDALHAPRLNRDVLRGVYDLEFPGHYGAQKIVVPSAHHILRQSSLF